MSDSNSQSNQTTKQTDNRRVIGQNGISNEGGTVTVNTTTLDANVVNAAIAAVTSGNKAQAEAGAQALTSALGFGSSALKAAANAQSDALAFAESNSKTNSAMAYNVVTDALGKNSDSLDSALKFADKQNARAFDSLNQTENLVAAAYSDAKGRGALTDKILIGSIAAMALVAFAAIQK